jgi:hypothetical protein
LSLHSRFKRVKRNGMDKPSWWMVDMSEEVKRDRRHRNLKAGARIRTSPRDDGTFNIPTVTHPYGNANSVNSFSGFSSREINEKLLANQTNEIISPLSNMADPFVPQMVTLNGNQSAVNVGNQFTIYDVNDDTNTGFMSPMSTKQQQLLPVTTNYSDGDSALQSSLETIDNASVPTNLHGFAQAITVNLRDPTIVGNGQCFIERPTITLNVNADLCPSNSSVQTNHNNRGAHGQSGKANAAEEARQFLRVQTANGTVQDVTIPAPVQLKIVIRGEKSCQTDDLESDLQYRLQLNSPTELHYCNNSSVINYSGTGTPSESTPSASTVISNDMVNEQQHKSVNISPYHHAFSENGLNGCVSEPLPWFHDAMKDGDLCETYNGFKYVH